jgi:ABC-type uncharacterized transport system substrate-binding protein
VQSGTSARNSSSRFAVNSPLKKLIPVKFPPGRARLATKPSVAIYLRVSTTDQTVFTTGSDPVVGGFVTSLNRPGGNVTGVTLFGAELGPKRLELLREILPKAAKIALFVNPNNPGTSQVDVEAIQAAARRLRLNRDKCVINDGNS